MYVTWVYGLQQCSIIQQTLGEDGVAQTFGGMFKKSMSCLLQYLYFFLVLLNPGNLPD